MTLDDAEIRKDCWRTPKTAMLLCRRFRDPRGGPSARKWTTETGKRVREDRRTTPASRAWGVSCANTASTNSRSSSTSCGATCRSWATARCPSTRPNASRATNISNGSCAPRASRDCGRSKNAGSAGKLSRRTAQAARHRIRPQDVAVVRPENNPAHVHRIHTERKCLKPSNI